MIIRKDILGNTPKIGDIIAYNPPYTKGIKIMRIFGFVASGLPKTCSADDKNYLSYSNNLQYKHFETPKTGFVIINHTLGYEIY